MRSPSHSSGSPWNSGERTIQISAGVEQRMDEIGRRVIRDHLTEQHQAFFPLLPFVVVGSVDKAGDAWATLIAGHPGFVSSADAATLAVTAPRCLADPAQTGLSEGAAIGLLGIELTTRRRNRVNGTVRRSEDGFAVTVDQSFGNCPKYIQQRDHEFVIDPARPCDGPVETLDALDDAARQTIQSADTFFVATFSEEDDVRQVDVSHRGGKSGFVRVEGETLTIPDFTGNFFFSTLGNILLTGKAGLVFANLETGDLLQLTGDAELVAEGAENVAFKGAERFWRFRPRRVVRRLQALPLRWTLRADGWSPNTLMTGEWHESGVPARNT